MIRLQDTSVSRTDIIASHAKLLLHHAFRLHQPNVRVDMKLIKGKDVHVFAADNYPTGGLKLVPYSQSVMGVALETCDRTPAATHIKIEMRLKEYNPSCKSDETTFIATFAAASTPRPRICGQHFVVPYWLVRRTGDERLANMGPSTVKCTASFRAGGEAGPGGAVYIPTLQNTKPIKQCDELLVYDEKLGTKLVFIEPQSRGKRASPSGRLNQPRKKAKKSE